MKRIYIKPEMVAVTCKMESVMLSKSESQRNIGGGPVDVKDGKILPPSVMDYNDPDIDPYGGHGQGTGGSGNRSKDWDDDVIYDEV